MIHAHLSLLSFNPFWVFVRLQNSAWDFWGFHLLIGSGDFWGVSLISSGEFWGFRFKREVFFCGFRLRRNSHLPVT